MSVETLLSKLTKVKRTSKGKSWVACCPSHADRSPSLAITEKGSGDILVHCFGGCDVSEVLQAVGMDIHDLFSSDDYHKHIKPATGVRIYPRDVLECLRLELMIVAFTAMDLRKGKALSEVDHARLDLARERITNGMELANVE